jgi:hypothetical protein
MGDPIYTSAIAQKNKELLQENISRQIQYFMATVL